MLVEFEQNSMVQTKKKKKKHSWQSVDTILEDISVVETSA